MEKRGQISLEHLLILGMVILIILPLVIVIYSSTRTGISQTTEMQLESMCNDIASKAETLQKLGSNSWSTLDLKIPKEVVNISLEGNEISIKYKAEGGISEVVCFSDANLEEANFGTALENVTPGGRINLKIEPKGPFVCVAGEGTDCNITQCNDGIDNDGDGCADLADKGCTKPSDNNESAGDPGCWEPVCGNNIKEKSETTGKEEVCDGTDGGVESCEEYWLGIGDLRGTQHPYGNTKCGPACDANLDVSGCTWCGDGFVNGLEQCDKGPPVNYNGKAACADWGHFNHGTLSCKSDCTISTSNCGWQVCGNGIREGTEPCDGSALGLCTSRGFACCSPTCACSNDCGGSSPMFAKPPPGGGPNPGGD